MYLQCWCSPSFLIRCVFFVGVVTVLFIHTILWWCGQPHSHSPHLTDTLPRSPQSRRSHSLSLLIQYNTGNGGGIYVAASAFLTLRGVAFSGNLATGAGNDIYKESSGTLTCTASCSGAGMHMPSGSCSSPVAASVSGGTCTSYCTSHASDWCVNYNFFKFNLFN